AQGIAERYWSRLVEEAREECDSRMGCFLYAPVAVAGDGGGDGDGATRAEAWIPVADAAGPATDRVVLLVHGLDEPGDIWDDLTPALHEAGHTVVRFNYPNDQDPALSADAL